MNWWFTPISFILTLVIYIASPIILRFAIFRKPIEHKKARNFSLIYGAVFLIILAFVSKEMAILQALFIIPIFGVVNYGILYTNKNDPFFRRKLLSSILHLLLFICLLLPLFLTMRLENKGFLIVLLFLSVPYKLLGHAIDHWCETFFLKNTKSDKNTDKHKQDQ